MNSLLLRLNNPSNNLLHETQPLPFRAGCGDLDARRAAHAWGDGNGSTTVEYKLETLQGTVVASGTVRPGLGNILPAFEDPDQEIVTIKLTKEQAGIALAALNCKYCQELLFNGGDDTNAVYQSIDQQVYGVRHGREGVQEAGR
jgi:hypothetical protein